MLASDSWRYALVASAAFFFALLNTLSDQWSGDFWDHSAIVRELATHPLHPLHPLLASTPVTDHAFFTPYSLVVALFARFAHLSSIDALAVFGMINLVFLLIAIRLFVGELLHDERNRHRTTDVACFYLLLFSFFLWGRYAWSWSGFLHLRAIWGALPYPSINALAATLLGLSIYQRVLDSRLRERALIAVGLLLTHTLLTHPLTAITFCLGLGALLMPRLRLDRPSLRRLALLAGVGLGAGLLVLLWPYYPFLGLIRESRVYHYSNRFMYRSWVDRVFPALFCLPFVFLRLRRSLRDPLVWLLLGLAAVFIFGWRVDRYSYGRVISQMIFVAHLSLAIFLARLSLSPRAGRALKIASMTAAFYGTLIAARPLIADNYKRFMPGSRRNYSGYLFLARYTDQRSVIVTDPKTGFMVPSFSGKVIALPVELAFIHDHERRRADLRAFFFGSLSDGQRVAMLRRYKATHILLNARFVYPWSLRAPLSRVGVELARRGQMTLYRLRDKKALDALVEADRRRLAKPATSRPTQPTIPEAR